MKTLNEYLQSGHINSKHNEDVFDLHNLNFKYFCNLKTEDKYDVLGHNKNEIIDVLNAAETATDYNSSITIEFKDGYLHIGAYYDSGDMKIYVSYLFSENSEFPDKEWSDCDWRNAIDVNHDDDTKMWILTKDMSMFADELIKHKI